MTVATATSVVRLCFAGAALLALVRFANTGKPYDAVNGVVCALLAIAFRPRLRRLEVRYDGWCINVCLRCGKRWFYRSWKENK